MLSIDYLITRFLFISLSLLFRLIYPMRSACSAECREADPIKLIEFARIDQSRAPLFQVIEINCASDERRKLKWYRYGLFL
jgi:hypothetical protein